MTDGACARSQLERAVQRRVIERRQRGVNQPDRPPQIDQERMGLARRLAHGPAIQPGQKTHEVPVHLRDVGPGLAWQWHGNETRPREMPHRCVLGLQHATVFAWVRDLEDETDPVG